jgi:hypothetical protein
MNYITHPLYKYIAFIMILWYVLSNIGYMNNTKHVLNISILATLIIFILDLLITSQYQLILDDQNIDNYSNDLDIDDDDDDEILDELDEIIDTTQMYERDLYAPQNLSNRRVNTKEANKRLKHNYNQYSHKMSNVPHRNHNHTNTK